MKKSLKWILVAAAVVFGLLQLTNVGRPKPVVTPGHDLFSNNPPPPEISGMVRSACYDCHSYETHWPWYGHIAPVSWWLDEHVRDAREQLNFSEWPHDDAQRAAKKWRHVADSVRENDMPLPSYLKLHKAARLTDDQRKRLADWAEAEAERLSPKK